MPPEQPAAQPSAGFTSYETIGDRYGQVVDTRPYNAYYERPAMLSLLPPLQGLNVLDIGSGNGWYAETLLGQGANVTAFDVSPVMVAQTQARVGERARVLVADLAQPFTFAADQSFDLVVAPLVLHYVAQWEPTLREIHRVLRPGGLLVFSTHHPTTDYQHNDKEPYFDTVLVEEEWPELGRVQFYRRPLMAITDALLNSGLVIERILEPLPTEEFRQVRPEAYARLLRFPNFLLVRARRP